jgi:hypothetical protein
MCLKDEVTGERKAGGRALIQPRRVQSARPQGEGIILLRSFLILFLWQMICQYVAFVQALKKALHLAW